MLGFYVQRCYIRKRRQDQAELAPTAEEVSFSLSQLGFNNKLNFKLDKIVTNNTVIYTRFYLKSFINTSP